MNDFNALTLILNIVCIFMEIAHIFHNCKPRGPPVLSWFSISLRLCAARCPQTS